MMTRLLRGAMNVLDAICIVVASAALVVIAVIVPYGVFTRYALNEGSAWPEPGAILLTILMTFLGGCTCYRGSVHMRVTIVRETLPPVLKALASVAAELVVGLLALFMLVHGTGLVQATWHQEEASFPWLSVGVTYLPIPVSGLILLLFVAERLLIGPPSPPPDPAHAISVD
jgi:TRAP-type C4-dicarboxylate transport system permease small subunit